MLEKLTAPGLTSGDKHGWSFGQHLLLDYWLLRFEGQWGGVLFSDTAESHCWVFVLYCDTKQGTCGTVVRTSQLLDRSVSKRKK